jgi:ADP-ribosyl-[dinitrogen reductase] hydrolase
MPTLVDRYRGCLLGLACGDAVGTTVEFSERGSFEPLTDMVGGGPFRLEAGQWTDDTSMALCLATSLISCKGFDATDQMNRYVNWWQWGYLSSTGECFDIGLTVAKALQRYLVTKNPLAGSTDPSTAGNGSLMRLAPVVMYYHPDMAAVLVGARESSATTHQAVEAMECCEVFAEILANALGGSTPTRRRPSRASSPARSTASRASHSTGWPACTWPVRSIVWLARCSGRALQRDFRPTAFACPSCLHAREQRQSAPCLKTPK